MKTIEWLDTTREIPTVGVANKGDILILSDDKADNFIAQGKAKLYKPTKVKENDNA